MEQASELKPPSIGDILIRSRKTILDLLERRGYNVEPYRKFVGPDLLKTLHPSGNYTQIGAIGLRIDVVKRDDPTKHAIVDYRLDAIRQSVSQGVLVKRILADYPPAFYENELINVSPETTEVIILYIPRSLTEENEPYDKAALDAWVRHKLKIQFFPIHRLVYNPLEHMLQPQFRIVPEENVDEILKSHYARSKTQFPFIRFHSDMVARCLGLVPGQLVEVTRPSPSAGTYVLYRTCVP